MARLRYNGLTATLGADLLTADTTITFAAALTSAAGAVPTITGTDYIPLAVLDTDGSVLEIIHLTAYTSGATTGTVTRAQESTTAADHASGLTVVNGLTVADATEFTTGGGSATVGTRVTRATSQSIPASTWTTIIFTAEAQDDDNWWTSGSPTRITVGAAGWYHASAFVQYAGSSSGTVRLLRLLKNGGEYERVALAFPGATQANYAIAAPIYLAATDYVEVATWHDGSAAINAAPATLMLIRL